MLQKHVNNSPSLTCVHSISLQKSGKTEKPKAEKPKAEKPAKGKVEKPAKPAEQKPKPAAAASAAKDVPKKGKLEYFLFCFQTMY